MRDLRNTEKVKIGDKTYVLSDIPAFQAQKIMMKAFGALASGNVGAIPPDIMLEVLSYAAIINPNGAEVQFENEDLVDMLVPNTLDLVELESRMVEKNFGFFADGRFRDALNRLTKSLTGAKGQAGDGTPGT